MEECHNTRFKFQHLSNTSEHKMSYRSTFQPRSQTVFSVGPYTFTLIHGGMGEAREVTMGGGGGGVGEGNKIARRRGLVVVRLS